MRYNVVVSYPPERKYASNMHTKHLANQIIGFQAHETAIIHAQKSNLMPEMKSKN